MIAFDPLLSALTTETGGQTRNQTDNTNQQDAWLRQMELQQIALMQQEVHPVTNSPMRSSTVTSAQPMPSPHSGPASPNKRTPFNPEPFPAALSARHAYAIVAPAMSATEATSTTTTDNHTPGLPLPPARQPLTGDVESGATGHAAPSTPPPSGSPTSSWQKRVVHLVQQGNQLSVSIRDASLNTWQAGQIVYRIVSEASRNGLKLHQAFINGRSVTSPATPHSPISAQEQSHGA